jgi:hypothetical protein
MLPGTRAWCFGFVCIGLSVFFLSSLKQREANKGKGLTYQNGRLSGGRDKGDFVLDSLRVLLLILVWFCDVGACWWLVRVFGKVSLGFDGDWRFWFWRDDCAGLMGWIWWFGRVWLGFFGCGIWLEFGRFVLDACWLVGWLLDLACLAWIGVLVCFGGFSLQSGKTADKTKHRDTTERQKQEPTNKRHKDKTGSTNKDQTPQHTRKAQTHKSQNSRTQHNSTTETSQQNENQQNTLRTKTHNNTYLTPHITHRQTKHTNTKKQIEKKGFEQVYSLS